MASHTQLLRPTFCAFARRAASSSPATGGRYHSALVRPQSACRLVDAAYFCNPGLVTVRSYTSPVSSTPVPVTAHAVPTGQPKAHVKFKAGRWRRWGRNILLGSTFTLAGTYLVDRYYCGSSIARSARAYNAILGVTLDYKLHFGAKALLDRLPDDELHQRNAQRICDMLQANGGLYLKIGQAIAMQGAMLPEQFQRMFATNFDNAPHQSWRDVEQVFCDDFGMAPEELLGGGAAVIDHTPTASASIAQVHRAKMADGRLVAIKVQKRNIAQQVWWDMWTLELALKYAEFVTDLPVANLGAYFTEQIMRETDFLNEAANANRMADLVEGEPRLRDRVYIPRPLPELTSKRVMTCEWVDGVQLWDKDRITAPWTGGVLNPATPTSNISRHGSSACPTSGLGLKLSDVMSTVMDLFSIQLFVWGVLHCDPHPGNIFIRRLPSGKPQVVLIDHGLYVTISQKLRRQYCLFWTAMLAQDDVTLQAVAKEWGLKNPDATANALLLRPHKPPPSDPSLTNEAQDGNVERKETSAKRQERIIREAGELIGDEKLWPREFVFIERILGILQGNNRFLGSPVNRIKRLGIWASYGLLEGSALDSKSTKPGTSVRAGGSPAFKDLWRHLRFRMTLLALDLGFYTAMIKQYLGFGGGFEEDIKAAEEKQTGDMKDMIRELFSIDL